MNVLVINSGSSSLKFQLIDMENETALCSGLVERIGQDMGKLVNKIAPDTDDERKVVIDEAFPNHEVAMKRVVELLTDEKDGVIKDKSEIGAIGHRVLLGGEEIKESVKVDDNVKEIIRKYIPLGPLHNPANLDGIEVCETLFPGTPNVGVFDTEFHQTMPEKAFLYPLPYDLYEDLRIRRYGFHGTSHRFVAKQAAKFMGKAPEDLNLVICHLGNGCSMSAVKAGKCVDTTMGITPLEGLMMGTRCGDIDPALVPFIMDRKGLTGAEVDTLMNKQSGLFGICGMSDMRDIHAAVEKGDEKAKTALDMFVYRIKKYIGSFIAALGNVDAIVFTAGIGENDDIVREMVCADMDLFGIKIDVEENATRRGTERSINGGGKTEVLIIPTNEELEIAQATVKVLA
ncbi:acetate kinase [Halodesulfovibrio sp.]|jgi:acetate kinase|uniref:acetate kinase n=1 Tax=Halodesulfovibrio sp. TaxID=1912772 RepID=UPI0025D21DF1|nr:acetate kinase [Halodesulfovibrio sp.]MCT4535635.1 acetate kinase [Halodesulfovibrio sp.]MCT4626622.1 acetate kinase [Halodesulfovibrio sp.]